MNIETPIYDEKKSIIEETVRDFSDLKNTIIRHNTSKEQQESLDAVRLGKKIDRLSCEGATTYEILIGTKKVGSVVKFEAEPGWSTKSMFLSAERSPALFTIDANGNSFPNIGEIEKYFSDKSREDGKIRKITMISTGPTFASYNNNDLAGLNYDNGIKVGTDEQLDGTTTKDKAIISITGGKLSISHTQEMTQTELDNLKNKQADIMTMSSMKRNGNINNNTTLWNHPYGHSLVQFNDGTLGEVILNNCTSEEKKQVISGLDISRAVYADADAKSNYLDGIRIQTTNGLTYSHPENGDLFINENVQSGKVIQDNIPGIIIQYAIQE